MGIRRSAKLGQHGRLVTPPDTSRIKCLRSATWCLHLSWSLGGKRCQQFQEKPTDRSDVVRPRGAAIVLFTVSGSMFLSTQDPDSGRPTNTIETCSSQVGSSALRVAIVRS